MYNVCMNQRDKKRINRSGKKACNICNRQTVLHIHHIEGRDILNAEHPSNKCEICPSCHAEIHEGLIVIEKWASTSSGKKLLWFKKGEESFTGEVAKPYIVGESSKSSN